MVTNNLINESSPYLLQHANNPVQWYAIIPLVALQLMITYIPGLNSTLFGMAPQDGKQWGIVILMMACTFIVMEFEKMVRNKLKASGYDTSDRQMGSIDNLLGPRDAVHHREVTEQ